VVIGQTAMNQDGENQGATAGSAASSLYQPMSIYFDGTKLYVADSGDNRIVVFGDPSSSGGSNDNNGSSTNDSSYNVTSNQSSLPYSAKKANRKVVFTFSNLSLGKAKKSWVTIRLGGRKVKVNRVRGSGTSTLVTVTVKQKGWLRGTYDLSMGYKKKVGKKWERGTRSQSGILSIY